MVTRICVLLLTGGSVWESDWDGILETIVCGTRHQPGELSLSLSLSLSVRVCLCFNPSRCFLVHACSLDPLGLEPGTRAKLAATRPVYGLVSSAHPLGLEPGTRTKMAATRPVCGLTSSAHLLGLEPSWLLCGCISNMFVSVCIRHVRCVLQEGLLSSEVAAADPPSLASSSSATTTVPPPPPNYYFQTENI